jgi:photosystem II stability/assembly factor-like uncharacterized protein
LSFEKKGLLFVNKKKQKIFFCFWSPAQTRRGLKSCKSFLVLFSKKELLACLLLCGCFTLAAADTGVRALDESAIHVKAPASAFLDAITRAGNRLVAAGQHGIIIYSDDNGITWAQAAVPVNVELTAIAFASPEQGWAVGHYGVILHTKDAGTTWQIQLNGLQANQLTLAAAQSAVAANDPSPGTPLAEARASHFMSGGADKPFLTIWAQDSQDAIIFGAYRLAMKTTDGGQHWVDWSLHIGDPYSHNLDDVAAVDGQMYIVGETGLIFHSTDGGASFPAVPPPGNATLFGVIGTGDHGVLVFGVAGQAYSSRDAGRSWQPVAFGTSDNLTAAAMLADGSIVVANEDGKLYNSSDHGENFSPLRIALPMAVFDLVQALSGDLVVVGNGGVLRVPRQDLKLN